jgi:alanine racemase
MFLDSPAVPKEVWIKLNTGMNRLGLRADQEFDRMLEQLKSIEARINRPLNWMMHFANADASSLPDAPTPAVSWASQQNVFENWLARLFNTLRSGGARSLANSAASMTLPQTHADWVRPGTALYGGTPFSHAEPNRSSEALGLMPVQRFLSEVIAIQELKVGEAVGYGSRFRAERPTRIAVVACGYADGYPRSAPDGTPVWIAGRAVPMAGRVSMDMLTVDVTDHPAVAVGSKVELWGTHLPIDQVANISGTIGYELMTRITPRVPRVVMNSNKA